MRKKPLSVLLTGVLLLMSTVMQASAYTSQNWMGEIDDSKTLSKLSIPGTHDSGALYEPFPGTAKCQSLTIAEQLEAGVRFLDIRCRHIDDAFAIHHGAIYQNMNFDDVLNACISFLEENPTETIIMSVKEEYTSSNITRTFEETFNWYVSKNPSKWYLHSYVPALSEARGKIVLLRRFSATAWPLGIDAANWADNAQFTISYTNMNAKIQDYYIVSSNDTKWAAITALYGEATTQNPGWLYINFTSGYKSLLGIPSITYVSNNINPRLNDYFTTNTSGRFGITVMDFATESICSKIINTNFN